MSNDIFVVSKNNIVGNDNSIYNCVAEEETTQDVTIVIPADLVQTAIHRFSGRRHPCLRLGPCKFGDACCAFRDLPVEVCRYFMKNSCSRGIECPDVHISTRSFHALNAAGLIPADPLFSANSFNGKPSSLKRPFEEQQQEDHYAKQISQQSSGGAMHAPYSGQTHPCLRHGPCRFGNTCKYRNVPREVCRYFLKNECSRGVNCPDVHPSDDEIRSFDMSDDSMAPSTSSVSSSFSQAKRFNSQETKQPLKLSPKDVRSAANNKAVGVGNAASQNGFVFSGQLHPCLRFGTCSFADTCIFKAVPQEVCRYHLKSRCTHLACPNVHASWDALRGLGYQC